MRDQVISRLGNRHGDALESTGRGDFDLNPTLKDQIKKKYQGRPAAVLVPLVDYGQGMKVLLTRRTDHLPDHAGQVAFPGGAREQHDSDAIATALRETEEEIGLARRFVDVVGQLDLYETSTGFHVTPVVGIVEPGFRLSLDAREVAAAFEVPLPFLLDARNHKIHSRVFMGKRRYYYAIPYGEHYIWGATAGMLMNLFERLTGEKRLALQPEEAGP